EAGGAGLAAVARVGAPQAGREMRHHQGAVPASALRMRQFGLEPGAAGQALVANAFGVERAATVRRAHQAQEVAGGAHRAFTLHGTEEVEVAPARGADDAHALA